MNVAAKRFVSVRYRLLGRADVDAAWTKAVEALEYGAGYHTVTRKDGITPEYDHQISIVQHLITLPAFQHPVETIAAACLHDVREDHGLSHEEIAGRFGGLVAEAVELLTKKFRGEHKDAAGYFEAISNNPIASLVKGADRVHNLKTMRSPGTEGLPVFPAEKQLGYAREARERFLPMLKSARRRFPQQETSYESLKGSISTMCDLIEALHPQKAACIA